MYDMTARTEKVIMQAPMTAWRVRSSRLVQLVKVMPIAIEENAERTQVAARQMATFLRSERIIKQLSP